jgi:hypothetical protein
VAHEQLPMSRGSRASFAVNRGSREIIKPIVACKGEADSRKVLDFLGKNDKAGLDKLSAPKLTKGDCLSLRKACRDNRHEDAKLFCVRLLAGLIAIGRDINHNASEPEARPATHSGGHRPVPIYRHPSQPFLDHDRFKFKRSRSLSICVLA